MALTLEPFQVVPADCGPVPPSAESEWLGFNSARNLILPATRYQFASVDSQGHTVTAYGAVRDGTSSPSLLISWELTDGLVYSHRTVQVADAACVGVFSAGGNTLVIRSNHGFGNPATGVWAILLSPPGEIKAPEDPLMIQLSEKPIYREYVNAAGDRITVIEAHSQQDPTRLDLKEFKVDFNSGVHELIRVVPNFEAASVERIGYNEKTGEFMVLRSEEARRTYLQERQKNSAPLTDPEQIAE